MLEVDTQEHISQWPAEAYHQEKVPKQLIEQPEKMKKPLGSQGTNDNESNMLYGRIKIQK